MRRSSVPPLSDFTGNARFQAAELVVLGFLTLLGAVLRLSHLNAVALSHFDEGVYASNLWFGPADHYAYPARHLYAPPLVPALIELNGLLLGPGDASALLPGLIAGCLLTPLVWWIGREWFGSSAGMAAAALCALNGPHAVFSRSALTDPELCLFLSAGIYGTWRWLNRGGIWNLGLASGCIALGWWAKYNGWYSLAVAVAAVPPWLWFVCGSSMPAVSRETGVDLADRAIERDWPERSARGDGESPAAVAKPENSPPPEMRAGQEPATRTPAAIGGGDVPRETAAPEGPGGGVSRETPPIRTLAAPNRPTRGLGGDGPGGIPRETPPAPGSHRPRVPPNETNRGGRDGDKAGYPVPRETPPGQQQPRLAPGEVVSRETTSPADADLSFAGESADRPVGGGHPVSRETQPGRMPPGPPGCDTVPRETASHAGIDQDSAVGSEARRAEERADDLGQHVPRETRPAVGTDRAIANRILPGPVGADHSVPLETQPGSIPPRPSGRDTVPRETASHADIDQDSALGSETRRAEERAVDFGHHVPRETSPAVGTDRANAKEIPPGPVGADHSVPRETQSGSIPPGPSASDVVPRETVPHAGTDPAGATDCQPGQDRQRAGVVGRDVPRETTRAESRSARLSHAPEAHGIRPTELAPVPSLPVSLGRLVLVCAVSIAAWSPCWLELADVGGYQAVSENHRRYVVGLSGAIPSAGRQLSALTCLEGPLGRWSLLLALLCVVGRFPRSANPRSSPIRIVCALLLGLAPLVVGSTLLTGLAAAIWCSTLLWPAAAHERRSLAPWLLAAWWGGLTMAVPCYTPYPRLALPWLVAGWLASGALFARWWGPEPAAIHKSEHPPPAGNRMDRNQWTQWAGSLMAAAGALAGVVWIAASSRAVETPPWRPQHGLQQAARELLGDIQQQLQSGKLPGEAWVVYVYGEPALFYQLKLAGVADCHPVQDLAFSRSETADRAATFLVIGDRTLRDPEFRKQLRSERRLELVRERTVAVPPLVWLDEPWEPIDASRVDREWDLELWRVKPGG